MKKVVIKQELKETSTQNLSVEKYYGIQRFEDALDKGFITQTGYKSGKFLVLCIDAITEGNGWEDVPNCKTLKTLVEGLLNRGFTVYEFDTDKELFKWLSE